MSFQTWKRSHAPDVIAPDGSEVRILGATARGSMAEFTLPPGGVSKPVAHRTVEEVWVFIGGTGGSGAVMPTSKTSPMCTPASP